MSGALVVLAGVLVVRAFRAERVRPSRTGGPTAAYVHHVGFGVVGLFDAFWVVTLMRLGFSDLAVGAVAVAIAVAGQLLLVRIAARVTRGRITVG